MGKHSEIFVIKYWINRKLVGVSKNPLSFASQSNSMLNTKKSYSYHTVLASSISGSFYVIYCIDGWVAGPPTSSILDMNDIY